jgi:hypothetical protein
MAAWPCLATCLCPATGPHRPPLWPIDRRPCRCGVGRALRQGPDSGPAAASGRTGAHTLACSQPQQARASGRGVQGTMLATTPFPHPSPTHPCPPSQPDRCPRRFSIFQMFQTVLLLGDGGRTVYQGPVHLAVGYFQHISFPPPTFDNPADFFLDVVAGERARALLKFGSDSPACLLTPLLQEGPSALPQLCPCHHQAPSTGRATTTSCPPACPPPGSATAGPGWPGRAAPARWGAAAEGRPCAFASPPPLRPPPLSCSNALEACPSSPHTRHAPLCGAGRRRATLGRAAGARAQHQWQRQRRGGAPLATACSACLQPPVPASSAGRPPAAQLHAAPAAAPWSRPAARRPARRRPRPGSLACDPGSAAMATGLPHKPDPEPARCARPPQVRIGPAGAGSGRASPQDLDLGHGPGPGGRQPASRLGRGGPRQQLPPSAAADQRRSEVGSASGSVVSAEGVYAQLNSGGGAGAGGGRRGALSREESREELLGGCRAQLAPPACGSSAASAPLAAWLAAGCWLRWQEVARAPLTGRAGCRGQSASSGPPPPPPPPPQVACLPGSCCGVRRLALGQLLGQCQGWGLALPRRRPGAAHSGSGRRRPGGGSSSARRSSSRCCGSSSRRGRSVPGLRPGGAVGFAALGGAARCGGAHCTSSRAASASSTRAAECGVAGVTAPATMLATMLACPDPPPAGLAALLPPPPQPSPAQALPQRRRPDTLRPLSRPLPRSSCRQPRPITGPPHRSSRGSWRPTTSSTCRWGSGQPRSLARTGPKPQPSSQACTIEGCAEELQAHAVPGARPLIH